MKLTYECVKLLLVMLTYNCSIWLSSTSMTGLVGLASLGSRTGRFFGVAAGPFPMPLMSTGSIRRTSVDRGTRLQNKEAGAH